MSLGSDKHFSFDPKGKPYNDRRCFHGFSTVKQNQDITRSTTLKFALYVMALNVRLLIIVLRITSFIVSESLSFAEKNSIFNIIKSVSERVTAGSK